MRNLIFVLAFLISVNVFGQMVYTSDQLTWNNDTTLVLNKSNNLPITGIVNMYFESGELFAESPY